MDSGYDVAISFAGEDRERAEDLARTLRSLSVQVFYDNDEKAELWGKDLYTHLAEVYQKRAQFCIVLISQHYARKLWTKHERKAMQARAFFEESEYILPVRLDETEIPGLLPTVGFLRWPPETAKSIARAIKVKLGHAASTQNASQFNSGNSGIKVLPRIQNFQMSVDRIFGKVNAHLSFEYIYGFLSRTVGYLSKAISQGQAVERDFIRPLSWLTSVASKVGVDLENAFISRYPKICPSCIEPQCICFKTGKKPLKDLPAYKVREELDSSRRAILNSKTAVSFDWGKNCISVVYPNNEIIWHYAGPGFHFSKLGEEVAEVHEAISGLITGKKNLAAVSDEIADVLAWLLGAWEITLQSRSMDQKLEEYYFCGCPVCQKSPCSCASYSSRPQNLFDSSVLTQVEQDLTHLESLVPQALTDIIEELRKSVRAVIETQDDPLARLTLYQIELKLSRVGDSQCGMETAHMVIPNITVILQKLQRSYRQ